MAISKIVEADCIHYYYTMRKCYGDKYAQDYFINLGYNSEEIVIINQEIDKYGSDYIKNRGMKND